MLCLIEEAVKLPAAGVEGSLLVFPAIWNEWASDLMNRLADEMFHRDISLRSVFVQIADDLPAENPQIVNVFLNLLTGQSLPVWAPAREGGSVGRP